MAAMKKSMGKGNHDLLDGVTYPFLQKLERHIPDKVTPNSITVMGFVLMLVAVFSLMLIKHPVGLLIFAVFSLTSTAFDGLDGIHARRTGQTSMFGDFLDHFLDQISGFLVMFAVLVRFDLFTPLYVFICLALTTINTLAFVFKSMSGYLYIGPLGPTTNLVVLCLAFGMIVVFNDPVLVAFTPTNPTLMHALVSQGVNTITIGKLVLLGPLLFLPSSFYLFYRLARQLVKEREDEARAKA